MSPNPATELAPERGGRALRNELLDRLYALHHSALLGFLRKRLGSERKAQDVAQESYLRLCRQGDLGKIAGQERAYLFTAAQNLLRDRQRRNAVRTNARQFDCNDASGGSRVDQETPLSDLEYKQTFRTVRDAVQRMRPKVRQVFLMRRLEEISNRQIAVRLGVSERTVERHMRTALRCLKEALLEADRRSGADRAAGHG